MKSYKVEAFGAPLKPFEEATPAPEGTEVLLRVAACGVCHSDLHLADGYFDLGDGARLDLAGGLPLPLTLGHEIAGEVVALGPEAEGVEVGDRRVAFPWIGCGKCAVCESGEEHLCSRSRALGVNRDGGYSDHVLVPDGRYLLDFGDLPIELACTYGCSGLTAYSALETVGALGAGDPLLIIGAGGVGMAAVALAKTVTGVDPIVADLDAAKREAAVAAGAKEAIDPAADGATGNLMKATGGVVAAIDFVGAEASANFGLDVLRRGGMLVVVGLFGGALTLPLPLLPLRAITVRGSYVGSLAQMRELMGLARAGRVPPIPVVTRGLDTAEATLKDLRAGRVVGRAVLVP